MATDKNFTRIKERVLDYAMSLWEIDNGRLIDPVAYLLNSQLSLDVLRKSTFPLIALSLYQSPCREEFISDIEFEKRMKEIFGAEWQDFLFMYQQQMKTPPQIPSDYGTIE